MIEVLINLTKVSLIPIEKLFIVSVSISSNSVIYTIINLKIILTTDITTEIAAFIKVDKEG